MKTGISQFCFNLQIHWTYTKKLNALNLYLPVSLLEEEGSVAPTDTKTSSLVRKGFNWDSPFIQNV